MKKPVVDYREFRFNRLNEPRFSHLKLLAGWIVYFIFYFLTENLIPASACHPMHCFMDDICHFNEYWVLAYCFWYLLIVISLGYFLLYDIDSFKKLQIFIMCTQAIAMVVYIIYPTRQDLRPDEFTRHNFCTWLLTIIYNFDTSTGVCPSLHVAYSMGIASVWLKKKDASKLWRAFVLAAVILICLSTSFVKQHSWVDIMCAIPVGILAELFVYHWLPAMQNNKAARAKQIRCGT